MTVLFTKLLRFTVYQRSIPSIPFSSPWHFSKLMVLPKKQQSSDAFNLL